MAGPTCPIFLYDPDDDDMVAFETLTSAESWLEPADVTEGTRAFDAEGRLLHVRVVGQVRSTILGIDQRNARVAITAAEDQPSHGAAFRDLLYRQLMTPIVNDLAKAPLAAVVEHARVALRPRDGRPAARVWNLPISIALQQVSLPLQVTLSVMLALLVAAALLWGPSLVAKP